MVDQTTQYEKDAYARGVDAAKAAASWVIDGNTPQEHIGRMVAWLDNGDPQADDYLPATPNLSGEWADDPTPQSLARDILGGDEHELLPEGGEIIDAIADAFERGVSETFMVECERILRAAL